MKIDRVNWNFGMQIFTIFLFAPSDQKSKVNDVDACSVVH